MALTWADTEREYDPVSMAIRTGKPCINQKILKNFDADPMAAEALARGCASSIALPLTGDGHVLGALNIYASAPEDFDPEQVKLLSQLADDLAFGITALRTRVQRRLAEEKLKQSMEKLGEALEGTIQAMALIVESRDPYTAGHQKRVSYLAHAIAREMNLPPYQLEGIRLAGFVHDLGKVATPAEILTKPGRISGIEFNLIKSHPEVGYEILREIEFPYPIAQIVRQHHERIDGSGYPQGLSDGKILLEARILAVADVVEAIASHRPYRPALGVEKALEEIVRHRGVFYDALAVDACLRLFLKRGDELSVLLGNPQQTPALFV